MSTLGVRHHATHILMPAIRRDICAALCFCSCELRWSSTECVLLPCFNALPDIFAVMNCSVSGDRW